jgi:hypothetical protein
MWDKPEVRRSKVTYETREQELLQDWNFFKPTIEKGAQVFRHSNSKLSADRIISQLLDSTPVKVVQSTERNRIRKRADYSEAGTNGTWLQLIRSCAFPLDPRHS